MGGRRPASGPTPSASSGCRSRPCTPAIWLKVERKGRTRDELNTAMPLAHRVRRGGLRGPPRHRNDGSRLLRCGRPAPERGHEITGVVCGVRIADITDPLMRRVRILDKIVDELAMDRPSKSSPDRDLNRTTQGLAQKQRTLTRQEERPSDRLGRPANSHCHRREFVTSGGSAFCPEGRFPTAAGRGSPRPVTCEFPTIGQPDGRGGPARGRLVGSRAGAARRPR